MFYANELDLDDLICGLLLYPLSLVGSIEIHSSVMR